MSNDMRILITGASGFVGGRLVEACRFSGFATPIAAIRNWTRAARVARFPIEIRTCDILHADDTRRAVDGANVVVHCAYADDHDSIVQGTINLLEAARCHDVKHFVFLSTTEVYGSDVAGVISESAPTPFTGNVYGDAKIEAENICREFTQSFGVTILRPSIIYGPFGSSWSIGFARRLQSGNWRLLDQQGDGTANLVYVDDLVRAIMLSIKRNAHRVEVYNINGPDRVTWNQYFRQFNEALMLPPLRRMSASRSRLRTLFMDQVARTTAAIKARFHDRLMEIYLRDGWAGRQMKRLKGSIDNTPSGNELTRLYCRQAYYSDEAAQSDLNYWPTFDLRLGLELTTAWLRHHEYVPAPPGLAGLASEGIPAAEPRQSTPSL